MSTPGIPRIATLEWAQRAAAGELKGVEWVHASVDPGLKPFDIQNGNEGNGSDSFSHIPYSYFLPPTMAEAIQEAQDRGEKTLLEAIQLLFAWPEWVIATRDRMWTPIAPRPQVLAWLVEAYGIGAEIHRFDGGSLARLVARLAIWYPYRGILEKSLELLREGVGEVPSEEYAHVSTHGTCPEDPPLSDEVMACRSAEWWRVRREGQPTPELRIQDGYLRFQPQKGGVFGLVREDVLVSRKNTAPLSASVVRLLPVWCSLRLVVPTESSPKSLPAKKAPAKASTKAPAKAPTKAPAKKAPPKKKAKKK